MPIRPENRDRYPPDWPEISLRIRKDRAGDRCECQGECGEDHGGRCREVNGEPNTITGSRVILTTAHLNHQPECRDEGQLRAMCQRCHLAYDREHHIANVQQTASLRRISAAGTLELFNGSDLGDRTRLRARIAPALTAFPPDEPA